MKLLHGLILSLLLTVASGAAADTPFVLFNTNGGTGTVTGVAPDFTLTGANNAGASIINNYTLYIELVDVGQTFTFDWTYSTLDTDGAGWDPAGYLINNTLYQLSPETSGPGYSGSGVTAITLLAGDTFGWYVQGIDSRNGPGKLVIGMSAVTLVVPEPSSYALLLAGLLLVGLCVRRRHRPT